MNFVTYIRCSQIKKVTIVRSSIRFLVHQNLSTILGDKTSPQNLVQTSHAKPFDLIVTLKDSQTASATILHHSIFAQELIATANVVALEEHRWILVVEIVDQTAVHVVENL